MIDRIFYLNCPELPPNIGGNDEVIVFVYDPATQPNDIDWQWRISKWMIANRCRHMTAYGPNTTTWDDSVDFAYLEANNGQCIGDNFCMTDWFSDGSKENALEFWLYSLRNDEMSEICYIIDLSLDRVKNDWHALAKNIQRY